MANCLKAAKQEYRKSNLHKIVLGNHIKETKFQEINKNKTIQICKSSFGRFQYGVSLNKCKLFLVLSLMIYPILYDLTGINILQNILVRGKKI